MKLFKTIRRRIFRITIGLAFAASAAIGPHANGQTNVAATADTQGFPFTYISPTNLPPTMATATASTNFNFVFNLRKGQGLGISWTFNNSGTNQAPCYIYGRWSVDGTNWPATNFQWQLGGMSLNTTNATYNTNWNSTALAGFASGEVYMLTNGTAGTLTNVNLIVNRPNN